MARKVSKEETPRKLPNVLLRRAREERNWSQQEVADQIGTTLVNVSRWERNVTSPQPYYRQKLCDLFGKSAHELGLLELPSGTAPGNPAAFKEVQSLTVLPTHRSRDTAPTRLMAGDTELVGRESLFAHLKQRLCAGETLALHGLPGVGKTALSTALTTDRQVHDAFPDGRLHASLGPEPKLLDILHEWGVRLEIPDEQTGLLQSNEDWARALRSAIGMRRMLIVLDDAWKIEDAVALKVGGPGSTYLLTTRFPAVAAAFALRGAVLVPELSEEEGIALLGQFVPKFVSRDPATASVLVHLVGALPLALTLMGKYLYVQTYSGDGPRRLHAAIAHLQQATTRLQLSAPISLADRPAGLAAGMSASLWSMIAMSDQHLDEKTRAMLSALSVFPAKPESFSVEAAFAVSGQTLEELDHLLDAGLLEDAGLERYRLHQCIADYARLHLQDDLPWRRLIDYALACAESDDPLRLLREESTILAGLEAAQRMGQHEDLMRGVIGLVPMLLTRRAYSLALRLLRQAGEAAQVCGKLPAGLKIRYWLGKLEQRQGNYPQALASFQQALPLARKNREAGWEYRLLAALGVVESRQGSLDRAELYLREALRVVRGTDLEERRGPVLLNLGWIVQSRRDAAQAEPIFREAVEVLRTVDKYGWLGLALLLHGESCAVAGKCAEAEASYQEGLRLVHRRKEGQQSAGDTLDGTEMVTTLEEGVSEDQRTGTQPASAHSPERIDSLRSLSLAHPVGYHELVCRLLMGLGGLAVNRGDDGQAQSYYQEGVKMAQQVGDRNRASVFLLNLAEIAMRQGKLWQAEDSYQQGLALARRMGHPGRTALLLLKLAQVKIKQGNMASGETSLQEGLLLAQQAQDQQALRLAHDLRATLQAQAGS